MASFNYDVFRRLEYAVMILATGRGDIKERLTRAWRRFSELRMYPTPFWLKKEVEMLSARWESQRPHEEGTIYVTVEKMSLDECVDEAEKIWDWYNKYRGPVDR